MYLKDLGDANIFYTVMCENGIVQRGIFSDSSDIYHILIRTSK